MDNEGFVVGFSTIDSEDKARLLARTLVGESLAACINILPITSVYRWRDENCEERETLCIIKTRLDRVDALKHRMAELHSYDCPELVFVPIVEGLPDYLAWVSASVALPGLGTED